VPSILSGVSVAAGLAVQSDAVLPFDLAHRAGAVTLVASAQELGWANVDRCLRREQFDTFRSAGDLGPSEGDDLGVPDELALAEALQRMDGAVAAGKRFMGLVRTNGTHGPYRVDPQDAPWKEDPGFSPGNPGAAVKYLNALHRVDREFGAFWRAFAARPWFDDVLVIMTADHGEAFGQHGLWWHCGAFCPEESHVPGMIRLPAAWRGAHPEQERRLRDAARQTQFVTALVPTAGALLGWPEVVAQASQPPLWEGPPVTPVVFTNCSDLRACPSRDLGLYDGTLRWVRAANTGRWEAWDEAADPTGLNELAASRGGTPRDSLERLRADPVQRDVVRRALGE